MSAGVSSPEVQSVGLGTMYIAPVLTVGEGSINTKSSSSCGNQPLFLEQIARPGLCALALTASPANYARHLILSDFEYKPFGSSSDSFTLE